MDGSKHIDMSCDKIVTSKPVLVTGAGGWIASHIIYQLLEKGYRVRGTVRKLDGTKYRFLRDFHPKCATHLELVEADLLKPDLWDAAVAGCEYVLHVASPFSVSYRDQEQDLVRPAVDGARHVLEGCFKNCTTVKRIVQTSSVCAIVYGHSQERYRCTRRLIDIDKVERYAQMHPGKSPKLKKTEIKDSVSAKERLLSKENTTLGTGERLGDFKLFTEDEFSVADNICGYELSKTAAELEAWKLVKEHNKAVAENAADEQVEMTALCPAFVFGPVFAPAHAHGESSSQIKRTILKTYPFVPDINSSHVDVRDVAKAHVLAMEASSEKVNGKRFAVVADDGNLTFTEQACLIAQNFNAYGFSPATVTAPEWLVRFGAWILSSVRSAADKLDATCYVSNERIRKELGFTEWRSVECALRDHCLSLMKCGAIERRKVPEDVINAFQPY